MRNFDCAEIETCFEDCRFCDLNRDMEKIIDSYKEFRESMQAESFYNDNFNKFNY